MRISLNCRAEVQLQQAYAKTRQVLIYHRITYINIIEEGDHLNDVTRRYKKEMQKRVIINLKKSDFNRWNSYAAVKSEPVATMIRKAVEKEISEMEDSFDTGIEDLYEMQEKIRKEVKA